MIQEEAGADLDVTVLLIFVVVYAGMLLGRIPGLKLDRTGIALVGAAALLVTGRVSLSQAWASIDAATITLLLGLMLISGQFRLAGFYGHLTRRMSEATVPPGILLAMVIATAGVLSALVGNDIVCLAVTPMLIEGCASRELDPVPFLLALACAANIGSAATLIGNPQVILIGQTLHLSFTGYLATAVVPATLGLAVVWAVVWLITRSKWERPVATPTMERPQTPAADGWQSTKAVLAVAFVICVFVFTDWPRATVALAVGAVLLLSRRTRSRRMLAQVDWQLLVLFISLFIVNHALQATGMYHAALGAMQGAGWDVTRPGELYLTTAVLSNLVSNVPAVMLLLPSVQVGATSHWHVIGAVLALSSTLAGNLLIVGSVANIIVVNQAKRLGVTINWRTHARVGVVVTVVTLVIAGGWLWICWGLG